MTETSLGISPIQCPGHCDKYFIEYSPGLRQVLVSVPFNVHYWDWSQSQSCWISRTKTGLCIGPVQNWGPANLCTLPYSPKPREVVVYVAGDQILDIQLSDITNQTKQTLKLLLPGISSQRFVFKGDRWIASRPMAPHLCARKAPQSRRGEGEPLSFMLFLLLL